MGGDGVEQALVGPLVGPATPRAGGDRVHHPAAAAPLAASVVGEPLGGLQGLPARVLVGDVAAAAGGEREAVRHHPAAVGALRAGLLPRLAPFEPAAAVRAPRPAALPVGRTGAATH